MFLDQKVVISFLMFFSSPVLPGKELKSVNLEKILLPTCCNFQHQFEVDNSACSVQTIVNHLPFPTTLNVRPQMLAHTYRNRTQFENISFGLRRDVTSCPGGSFQVTFDLEENDPSVVSLTMNGYLQIATEYYSMQEYCIDGVEGMKVSAAVCKPTCDILHPCIPKCCEIGELWEFGESEIPHCVQTTKSWTPTLYKDKNTELNREEISRQTIHFSLQHLANGFCDYGHPFLIPIKSKEDGNSGIVFRILSDGSVLSRVRRREWVSLPKGDFCMDGFKNPFQGTSSEESPQTLLLYCHKETQTSDGTLSKIYGISMVLSSIFLLVTLGVFALLWEKHRFNIQRWTLASYVLSLLLMYFFFILSYFSNYFDGETITNPHMCRFIGIGMHFTFLLSFSFLSSLNFEIWWTVRSFTGSSKYFNGFQRLFAYIIFSVGLSSIILSVGLILEAIYESEVDSEVIIPEYGRYSCNIGSRDAFWAYMYGPVAFLLAANLIFFFSTVVTMWRIFGTTKNKGNVTVNQKSQTDFVSRFGKLYLIQGLPWIFEILSFAAHEDEVRWYWILLDLINIFQSVGIFLIFVWNRETLYELQSKYSFFRKFICPLISKTRSEPLSEEQEEDEESGKASALEIPNTEQPKETIQMQ